MVVAVRQLAASLARKAITLAISSGFAIRPRGIAAPRRCIRAGSFMLVTVIGVATAPGPTPHTRMPCGASSTSAVRVSILIPPFETQ
jgi:hypothetical protein